MTGFTRFRSPGQVLFGPGVARSAGTEVSRLGRRALVVTDPGVIRAGLLSPVTASLAAADVAYVVYDSVHPDPHIRCAQACAAVCREHGCNVVVGLGGGSPLDVAKATALLVAVGGELDDYFGIDRVPRPGLPTVMIPTTAGTGSEATATLVLCDERDGTKRAAWSSALLPTVALVDPELTFSLPPAVTADTGLDALVHCIEAYLGRGASPLTDALALMATEMISQNLVTAHRQGHDLPARSAMLMAATMGGIAHSSAGLGCVHILGYPLTERFHIAHGRANALMLPHVLAYNLVACLGKAPRLAAALGGVSAGTEAARAAIPAAVAAVRELTLSLSIPARLRDYDVPRSALAAMAEEALHNGARLLPNNPRPMDVAAALGVFTAAW